MSEDLSERPEDVSPTIAEAVADQRLARDRFDMPALVAKADHRLLAGDHRSAASFYAFAVKCADAQGTADRTEGIERARKLSQWLGQRFRRHILSGIETAGYPMRDWPERFRAAIGILFGDRQRDLVYEKFPQMPKLFFYPGLSYVDFVDTAHFPWRAGLEACFPEMREEVISLLADTRDFSPYVTRTSDRPQGDVYGLLENPDWSSLYLWTNGGSVDQAVARCPRTFQAVMDNIPLCHIGRQAPAVLLSLLRPGTHIPPHTGMLNVRYICHLPLIVPEDCWLRVGERRTQWQEGRLLAFDDTVEHEACNGSSRDRLVLIFDVWNPQLGEEEKLLIRTMLELVDGYR